MVSQKGQDKQECVFIILLVICWLCVSFASYLFWRLTSPGFQQIHPLLPSIIGILLAIILISIWFGIILFVKTLYSGGGSWYSYYVHKLISRYLFPLIIILGRFLNLSEENIQRSFIQINNRLVQTRRLSIRPERLMILLPQCLQNNDCTTRITKDIRVCKRCGRCQIAEIIKVLDRYNILCWVATGGTLARKYIYEYRPDAIIAVACARDLSSGIMDCFPIPVYGILNQRPEGPCINTLVDLERIKWAIQEFILGQAK